VGLGIAQALAPRCVLFFHLDWNCYSNAGKFLWKFALGALAVFIHICLRLPAWEPVPASRMQREGMHLPSWAGMRGQNAAWKRALIGGNRTARALKSMHTGMNEWQCLAYGAGTIGAARTDG